MPNHLPLLQSQRAYYEAGNTRSHAYRIAQLKKLKAALVSHEKAILQALHTDLGKSPTEGYITELGIVLSELSLHIKKLQTWMQPQRAATNILNLPSTTKVYAQPLGVVLIIAPWNYPFQLLMAPLIGAISGGNCAVLKPSELAPATEAILVAIIQSIFDEKYISIIKGNGAEIVPALMQNFRFDHVFFTGSVAVGKSVYQMAAAQLVPVTLELGGKSPAIVHADANLKITAKRLALGKWLNAGQTCIAPDYVLVHATIKDQLIKEIKQTLQSFYANAEASSSYGKIINEKRFNTLQSYLQQGSIVHGGQSDAATLFISPTLLENVAMDSPIMTEEIFGPILPILSFNTKEDALQIVQQNSHPLAFYLFTKNKETEAWWMQQVAFGGGCVNNAVFHFTNHHIAFGGIGNSGIGGYHGHASFVAFTHAKPVLKTPAWFDPSFKYPPYNFKSLRLFKWLMK